MLHNIIKLQAILRIFYSFIFLTLYLILFISCLSS